MGEIGLLSWDFTADVPGFELGWYGLQDTMALFNTTEKHLCLSLYSKAMQDFFFLNLSLQS